MKKHQLRSKDDIGSKNGGKSNPRGLDMEYFTTGGAWSLCGKESSYHLLFIVIITILTSKTN